MSDPTESKQGSGTSFARVLAGGVVGFLLGAFVMNVAGHGAESRQRYNALKELKKRGGARPGAGMPKGYKTAKTLAKEAAQAHALEQIGLTAQRVLLEMARLAFVDARSFWDETGNLKPFSELTADQGAALAGFEAIIKNAKAGDGITDEIHKIKIWDKPRALEMLAKHFGLLTDKVEHSGDIEISWKSPQP